MIGDSVSEGLDWKKSIASSAGVFGEIGLEEVEFDEDLLLFGIEIEGFLFFDFLFLGAGMMVVVVQAVQLV